MNDPREMGRLDSAGDAFDECGGGHRSQLLPPRLVRQGTAFAKLHTEVRQSRMFTDFVHLHDARMF